MKWILLMILIGCSKFDYNYDVGDCNWHMSGDSVGNYFKVVDQISIRGESYYISEVLNFKYDYDVTAYKLQSTSYIDSYHPKYSHEERCEKGIRKDLVEECKNNKDWKWNSKGVKCPTKEEYDVLRIK